jgi:hypothetical protein
MIDYLPKFNRRIDPQFKSLFRRRWREKPRRAKMNIWKVPRAPRFAG